MTHIKQQNVKKPQQNSCGTNCRQSLQFVKRARNEGIFCEKRASAYKGTVVELFAKVHENIDNLIVHIKCKAELTFSKGKFRFFPSRT